MNAEGAFFSIGAPGHPNQDSVLPLKRVGDIWICAIADGVGSYEGAATASRMAVETVAALTIGSVPNIAEVFRAIKNRLEDMSASDKALAHMATTLSAIWIDDYKAWVGHVGDTRIYHLRSAGIVDRTRDQTEVQRLLQEGVLTPARAKRYARRNVLLSALSADSDYELFEQSFEVLPQDRLILVSDGVHGKIPRRTIRDLAAFHPDPESLCAALRIEVEARTPEDDYSAVCVNVT